MSRLLSSDENLTAPEVGFPGQFYTYLLSLLTMLISGRILLLCGGLWR